ncbi:unnamed protein product [Euphydryas editha]|uniref:Uncharacterized protein n=1 Tax=Euphydryas editha TaxID=104508 RepID=A0AAU9UAN0_EUPED|nr:unnamed protein product [Euphydryas editha]
MAESKTNESLPTTATIDQQQNLQDTLFLLIRKLSIEVAELRATPSYQKFRRTRSRSRNMILDINQEITHHR